MTNTTQNIKSQAISGLIWRFMERFGAQGVTFVVSVVLARLLDPEVYGIVAIVTVFITILNVFIDSGLGNALIQKKDADDLDFSTVFIFNMVVCLLLYILLFLVSPLIAAFYQMPELTAVLRVMCLTVVISGVKNVQQAYVSRHLLFKRFFFATLGGTIGAAFLGIWMAFRGYGVWALVAQGLFNSTMDTLILWITVKWRPHLVFSWERFCALFSYGWKLLLSTLIITINNNLRQLIIGKMYTAGSLAFYNRGYMIPNTFVSNINTAIDSVLLPVMSGVQDDSASIYAMTRRSIRISAYIMWPIMMGIAAVSRPLVIVLLTKKWLPSVPYVIIFCIMYAFSPLQTANMNAIKAIGRSDTILRLTIAKRCIGFLVLLATMWFGPLAMALGNLAICTSEQLLNAIPNKKILHYSYREQIIDILPPMLLAVGMFAAVWSIQFLHFSNPVTLLLQIPTGIAVYIAGSVIFKLDSFYYLKGVLEEVLKNRKCK